jgi:hypothetical protein
MRFTASAAVGHGRAEKSWWYVVGAWVDATCQRSNSTRHRHSMKPPLTSIKVPAVASLSRCGTFWNTVDPEQIQNNPFEISDYHDYYMFLMRPRTTTYYLLHPGALCQVMPRASDMVPMLAGRRGARCSTNDSWLREKVFTLRAALHQIHLSHSAAACTRAQLTEPCTCTAMYLTPESPPVMPLCAVRLAPVAPQVTLCSLGRLIKKRESSLKLDRWYDHVSAAPYQKHTIVPASAAKRRLSSYQP